MAPSIVEVTCQPPIVGWLKVNTDGTANGSPGQAGGGGICRDSNGVFITCFVSYLEIQDTLYVELYSTMKTIHLASKRGWWTLWLDCDLRLVVDILNDAAHAPWKLQNEWLIC
ncbi:putative ribonuclease H-like domain-containing protein [Lupinus albus]|uniref:Putative ribonuclease H-like domain-containing protein n=1 Tax=Lupinus albus TaxID=3870 RepID=A0A6A4R1R7_LUPAL|nr:putative ribonuclease H-like domain-containing protein [Lupinus albus]